MVDFSAGPVILTVIILGYYTMLYGNNIIMRVTQRISLGVGLACYFVTMWSTISGQALEPLPSNPTLIIPIILGILGFFVLSDKYAWVGRYPSAYMLGITFGALLASTVQADILGQVSDTLLALQATDPLSQITGIIILISVLTCTLYFIYTLKITRPIRGIMTVGRYFLMLAIGAAAAEYTAGCMSWAIDPISRVVFEFLNLG